MEPAQPGLFGRYRTEGGEILIELRLSRIRQLFNSLDPSPFHEKDLDADAEEYIVDAARELPTDQPVRIVLHLPAEEALETDAEQMEAAIRNYFTYRLDVAQRTMRLFMRRARRNFATGLVVLVACGVLREAILGLSDAALARLLAEGFLIGGWVAMWQPIQMFIYDWRPRRETCRIMARLATASVDTRAVAEEPHGASPDRPVS